MSSHLDAVSAEVIKSNSVDEVPGLFTRRYDIDYITFHLMKSEGLAFSNPFVRTTYPDAWVRQYLLNTYIANDPVIEHVIEEGESFCWSELRIKPHHKIVPATPKGKVCLKTLSALAKDLT